MKNRFFYYQLLDEREEQLINKAGTESFYVFIGLILLSYLVAVLAPALFNPNILLVTLLGKLIHEELYKKEILDNEIGQLEKDIKRLNSELVLCIRSLEGDFERLKNSLSSLISSNGLANRRFRDYKKINGSGTNLNKDLLAIYLIYMNLIASNSDFKFPFAIDSFVKNEIDTISQEKMFSAISSYFLTLEAQTFFSVIRENLDKISGDYCEIRVESPLLKADKYEDVSREIIEYGY